MSFLTEVRKGLAGSRAGNVRGEAVKVILGGKIIWELLGSAKDSFEDCDQKFKVEIVKAGEKRK